MGTKWEKQHLVIWRKPSKPKLYMVIEYNSHYGDMVTAFQIGDKQHDTGVAWKFEGMRGSLRLTESNSLCGVRKFENGSITYEFLWKPLGLDESLVKRRKYPGGSEAFWTHYYSMAGALRQAGWEQA